MKLSATIGTVVLLTCTLAMPGFATVETPVVSSGEVEAGVWNSNYRATRAFAEQTQTPLMVFFGSKDCGITDSFINNVLNSTGFLSWLRAHKIAQAFKYGTTEEILSGFRGTDETTTQPDFRAALKWLKSVNSEMTKYPLIGLYWRKADGSVVQRAFSGSASEIPSVAGSGARTSEQKMLAVLNKYFGSYYGDGSEVEPLTGTVDMSIVSSYAAQLVNSNLYTSCSFEVPLMVGLDDSVRIPVGILTVSQTVGGALTVKYAGLSAKSIAITGAWSQLDLDTGVATVSLESHGCTFDLALRPDGVLAVSAVIAEGYSEYPGEQAGESTKGVASSLYSPFAGVYTVALPEQEGETGSGYMTMNVFTTGRTSWKALMPDGTSISATGALSLQTNGTARLTIVRYKRNAYAFSILLSISEAGIVTLVDDTLAQFVNERKGGEYFLTATGGSFTKKATPRQLCQQFGISEPLELLVDGTSVLSMSTSQSGVSFAKNGAVSRFTYASGTGVFSGSAKVTSDGKTVSGKFAGVVLPGVTDDGGLLGLGTFYATGVSLPVEWRSAKEAE